MASSLTRSVVMILAVLPLGIAARVGRSSGTETSGSGDIADATSAVVTPEEISDAFHPPSTVMAEVTRLEKLGLTSAVQAIVEGTSKLAVGHTAAALEGLAADFGTAMSGVTFLDIDDTPRPENVRYRKVMYIAACASLAAEARARADGKPHTFDSNSE